MIITYDVSTTTIKALLVLFMIPGSCQMEHFNDLKHKNYVSPVNQVVWTSKMGMLPLINMFA